MDKSQKGFVAQQIRQRQKLSFPKEFENNLFLPKGRMFLKNCASTSSVVHNFDWRQVEWGNPAAPSISFLEEFVSY